MGIPEPKPVPKAADWLTLGILTIIWGSSFILIKKALIVFSFTEVALLRIMISAVTFLLVSLFFIRPKLPRKRFLHILIVGLTGSGIPAFMYALAQTRVESAVTGILNSMTPIFTWLIGLFFFRQIFRLNQLLGVVLGFIGALALIFLDDADLDIRLNRYSLFIIVGTICYGISGNVVKYYLQNVRPLVISMFSFLSIGVIAAPFLWATDIGHDLMTVEGAWFSFAAVCLLSLFGTVFATIIFYKLVQNTSAVFGSAVAYLIPITAIAWGLLDGEALGWTHFAGLFLILTGIYVLRK